jgi:UDP-glucuronate 4-epimerase
MKKYILITGSAGFIGFHLTLFFLKIKRNIVGVDNINNYYDIKIKYQRLKKLKKYKNFKFFKFDINNFDKFKILNKYNISIIYHLAAQAGVRYSFSNPQVYMDSNVQGFFNVLEFAKKKNIKQIVFASSSSVYGNQKKYPLNENEKLFPENLYGVTKKINEEMASYYSDKFNIKCIGLRFFTVFGEFGRPDMFLIKFINAFKKKVLFELYNHGKHERDFTYVGDVVKMINKLKFKKKFDIYNICSNRPIKLMKVIKLFNKYQVKPKIKKICFQKGDVIKTHGSNTKIKNLTKVKITSFEHNLQKVINSHK